MSSKKQQTMAKLTRERTVKERRALKLEKKREKRLAASAEQSPEAAESPPPEVD